MKSTITCLYFLAALCCSFTRGFPNHDQGPYRHAMSQPGIYSDRVPTGHQLGQASILVADSDEVQNRQPSHFNQDPIYLDQQQGEQFYGQDYSQLPIEDRRNPHENIPIIPEPAHFSMEKTLTSEEPSVVNREFMQLNKDPPHFSPNTLVSIQISEDDEEESPTVPPASDNVASELVFSDSIQVRLPLDDNDEENVTYAEVHHLPHEGDDGTSRPVRASSTITPGVTTTMPPSSGSGGAGTGEVSINPASSSVSTIAPEVSASTEAVADADATTMSENIISSSASENESLSTSAKPPAKRPPYNAVLNCRCGTQSTRRTELGTIKSDTETFPWAVMINSLTRSGMCTGSIINSRYIMTSASCVREQKPGDLILTAGLTMAKNSTIRYNAERVTVHPGFNPNTLENNIALIAVREDILPTKSVKFVCLPISDSEATTSGTFMTLTRDVDTGDVVLFREQVKQIPNARCETLAKRSIPTGSFCSAPPSRHCDMGDGGSYIVPGKGYSFTIKGLVYSAGCKRKAKPTVYTSVDKYVRWVLYRTRSASYCKTPSYRTDILADLPE